MEELIKNFSTHISKIINPNLGFDINNFILKNNFFDNNYSDQYDEIEHEIKTILANYFKNCDRKEFLKISQNLYNENIETDDQNLISAVKLFVRFYSKFTEMKMKSMFYKWRINMLYKNKEIHKITEVKLDSKNNKKSYNKNNIKVIKNNYSPKNIFDKLYQNAFKKQDEKLLNNELKKLAEMEECTFKPNLNK